MLARKILERVFGEVGRVEIDRVCKIGQGSSHEVFAARIELEPDPDALSGAYAVFLPARGAEPKPRSSRQRELEHDLLMHVASQTSAIRVPSFTAIVPTTEGHAIVRPYIAGIPLDMRAGRQGAVRPWEVVAQVAAAIHGIDLRGLHGVEGYTTRRAHAEAEIAILSGVPELGEAEAWALAHLPREEPTALLHGDLLGRNILLAPEEPPAVIDWEHAIRGDPAHDLAIVTRGVRRPFQIDRGLARLLDAYAEAGGRRIEAHEVHLYELCLLGREYRDALKGEMGWGSLDQVLRQVQHVLGRARAAKAVAHRGKKII